jgi:hypothetical protein
MMTRFSLIVAAGENVSFFFKSNRRVRTEKNFSSIHVHFYRLCKRVLRHMLTKNGFWYFENEK